MQSTHAQFKVRGTVYDSSRSYPVEAVSVLTTSGRGTATDANGRYEIVVIEKDSIWFSYQNKPTIKFPVAKIVDLTQFDLAMHFNVRVLKEITIKPRNYRLDSIQNRADYAKAFNFKRPSIGSMTSIGPSGAGFDIDEIIRVFQFRKNRSMESFQKRLMQQEQDKFIDHRFNKLLVRRLTHLDSTDLDNFMILYRPSFEFTVYTSDFQFQSYIKEAFEKYMLRKNNGEFRKEGSE